MLPAVYRPSPHLCAILTILPQMNADMPENQSVECPVQSVEFTPGTPDPARGALEWVLADARGGFAMGGADATPARRYHGMLVGSLAPPVRRVLVLSAIDEHLHLPGAGPCACPVDARLTRFQFADDDARPSPPPTLAGFARSPGRCVWEHTIPSQFGAVRVRKTLTLIERAGACRIEYQIENGLSASELPAPPVLTLSPLLAMRDFHELNHPGTMGLGAFDIEPIEEPGAGGVRVRRHGLDRAVCVRAMQLRSVHEPGLWRGIRYEHDTRRGQRDCEDLLCPVRFVTELKPGASTTVAIEVSLDDRAPDINRAQRHRTRRVAGSIEHALAQAGEPRDRSLRDAIARLACAADDFVVDRAFAQTTSTSIIAGYPWFSDWGRDTMICIPGLLLTTGRFDEAHACLTTFAGARAHGLIPNRFDDDAGPAHFNTVDAPLWFVHACRAWSLASGRAVESDLARACDDIIDGYARGTINKIGLDPHDGLIRAGDEHTQLTWMDALRDGVAFTPRHGKAIEINALWINALRARIAMGSISDTRAGELGMMAQRAQRSVVRTMTAGPHGGLVDCLIPHNAVRSFSWQRSAECRPNQVFAVALAGVDLPEHIGRDALRAIERRLLTPVGLRTLSSDDPGYQGHYAGSMTDRDRAYHNGTVWPWLIGAYADARLRVGVDAGQRESLRSLLLGMAGLMGTDAAGSIHEIYDAEPGPDGKHAPQGCPAQAWSVGEVLRSLVAVAATGG